MRESIVAIVAAGARSDASVLLERGADRRDVADHVMRYAFDHFLAPEAVEAFAGACAALYELYPDDAELRQEVEAIGARNRVLLAIESGVPVDLSRVDLPVMPAEPIGLVNLMRSALARSGAVTR